MDIQIGDRYKMINGTEVKIVSITCDKVGHCFKGPVEVQAYDEGFGSMTWSVSLEGKYMPAGDGRDTFSDYDLNLSTLIRTVQVIPLCGCSWNKHPLFCKCK